MNIGLHWESVCLCVLVCMSAHASIYIYICVCVLVCACMSARVYMYIYVGGWVGQRSSTPQADALLNHLPF